MQDIKSFSDVKLKVETKKGVKMRALRKFFVISSAVLAISVLAGGDASAMLQKSVGYGPSQLSFSQSEGYDVVFLPGCENMGIAGAPSLPVLRMKFVIPRDMKVSGFTITGVDSVEIPGTYNLYPGQPAYPLNFSPPPGFTEPDSEIYSSSEPYPGILASSGYESFIGGWKLVDISIHPLQYIPSTGKLWLYSFNYSLELEPTENWSAPVERRTQNQQDEYVALVKDLVANPEDVELYGPQPEVLSLDSAQTYVIITPDSLADSFQPLADWNTRRGLRTVIYTLELIDQIYGQLYPGSDIQERIRYFIKDWYSRMGTQWVLLGGDGKVVPGRVRKGAAALHHEPDFASDLYYCCLDGDWDPNHNGVYGEVWTPVDTIEVHGEEWPVMEWMVLDYRPEIYLGRAQVSNRDEVELFVQKVLDYEFDPDSAYADNDFLLLGAIIDMETSGGVKKDSTVADLGMSGYRLYDVNYPPSTPPPGLINKIKATTQINHGYRFINHCGHGNYGIISMDPDAESFNNRLNVLTTEDFDGFINGKKYGLFSTAACLSAPFDKSPDSCLAAHWITNPNGGGACFLGHSSFGWGVVGDAMGPWEHLDRPFLNSLILHQSSLGQALTLAKDGFDFWTPEECSAWENWFYAFYAQSDELSSFTLLGDPAMPVWLGTPESLQVSYPELVPVGNGSFSVAVQSNGIPVANATVCLYKEVGDLYRVGYTGEDGIANFIISPQKPGQMLVTVTKNGLYFPWLGSSQVGLTVSSSEATSFNNAHRLVQFDSDKLMVCFSSSGLSSDWAWYTISEDGGLNWTNKRVGNAKVGRVAVDINSQGEALMVYPQNDLLKYNKYELGDDWWDNAVTLTRMVHLDFSAPGFAVDKGADKGYVAWYLLKESPKRYYLGYFDLENPGGFQYFPFDSLQGGDKVSLERREMLCVADYDHHHNPPPPPPEPGPSLDVDTQGKVHISWEKDGEIYYGQWDGANFSTIVNVSQSPGVNSRNPSLDCYDSKVWISWEAGGEVYCAQLIGGVLEETDDVSQSPGLASRSPVVEKGIVAWSEEREEGGQDILLKRYCPDFGWVDEGNISHSPQAPSSYPQILALPEGEASLRLYTSWTEAVSGTWVLGFDSREVDLGCPHDQTLYLFNLGQEEPLPETVQRDGYISYGSLMFQSVDYSSAALIYRLSDLDPGKEYGLEVIFYHQMEEELRQRLQIDGAIDEEVEVPSDSVVKMVVLLPDTCYADGQIMISISGLSGDLAVCPLLILHASIGNPGQPKRHISGLSLPQWLELYQNYPNPFNPVTVIRYSLPVVRQGQSGEGGSRAQTTSTSSVSLKVYNILGQVVRTLVDEPQTPGYYQVRWDGRDNAGRELASGIYIYRIQAGDFVQTRRMILLK